MGLLGARRFLLKGQPPGGEAEGKKKEKEEEKIKRAKSCV